MGINYKTLALIFITFAILLRGSLCLVNPPDNAFDNHFEPISLIMQNGTIPAKDACWECYQPPVFYGLSAMIGDLATYTGANKAQVMKLLQFTCCLYGILTLFIIYLILNKFNLSEFSKLIAFGLICFLPRHIYMCAMLSNDTISYLFISLCAYILIIAIEKKFPPVSLIILTIITAITIFTKYTSFIVIAMVLAVFILSLINLSAADRKKKAIIFGLSLFIPLSILCFYMLCNVKNYGKALPANYEIFNNSITIQPRDKDGISFLSFKPWESVKTPILVPGKLNSFWTIIYSGMWFDTEPKYLYFMDSNTPWWKHYYGWLRGVENFPGDNPSMSKLTILEGSGLIALGLFPLVFFIIGGYRYLAGLRKCLTKSDWMEATKMSIFFVLFISNAACVMLLALKLPVYSAMKASYFLNSMPAFAIFGGIGVMTCENIDIIKWVTIIIFGALFILSFLHILHICLYFLK